VRRGEEVLEMAEKKKEREAARALTPWERFGEVDPWSGIGEWGPFPGRMGRFMDDLLREWRIPARAQGVMPAMDVSENDNQYTISVELPGVGKEDVHVEFGEGMVTVRGEKRSEHEEKRDQRRYAERSYGVFSRSFRLPADADADRIDASFKDGVLTLRVPKTEASKPKTISIKGG
jgi:HSP20 family protein